MRNGSLTAVLSSHQGPTQDIVNIHSLQNISIFIHFRSNSSAFLEWTKLMGRINVHYILNTPN